MSEGIEKHIMGMSTSVVEEKSPNYISSEEIRPSSSEDEIVQQYAHVTEDDLLEAKELAATYTLEELRHHLGLFYNLHRRDPLLPLDIIERVAGFLNDSDVFERPEKHQGLIAEMRIRAALIQGNSPYAEVRAVVDNKDDPNMPCSTIRAWFLGMMFSCLLSFVNCFFEIRQPSIFISSNVPQLLAYPCGKFLEKLLPDVGITLFGVRHSLNPGPFNKKEHMLITIMAGSGGMPYTQEIVWIQFLPEFFNQHWAINMGYQILIGLSSSFIGYSLAGICRRFLVYPTYCVWPASLSTIALNSAFHTKENSPTQGPFGKIWRASRFKLFIWGFGLMFCYFWLPNTLFAALSTFSWMTWISPNNRDLSIITGSLNGLGLNPLPTFDWNVATTFTDPLVIPLFSTLNYFVGGLISMFVILGVYYSNGFNSAYLPINSNQPFDHFGQPYNISAVVDSRSILVEEKYQAYSPPYLSAGNLMIYFFYFSTYTAAVTYGAIYHRLEMWLGLKDLWNSFRPSKRAQRDDSRELDVHNRLMKAYPEVPEWWYTITLVISVVFGCVALTHWQTFTSPGVVFFGLALSGIFVVPTGIIFAMTGVEVPLNVLAEFIGGSFVQGNAIAMCFFKTYGVMTCSSALAFTNDLKMTHYVKVPPRFTFWAQMVPTFVGTLVSIGLVTWQVHIKNVCTADAPFKFTCPGENTFFTAAVVWGTIGPRRLWGFGGQYALTLLGFPLGVVAVLAFWLLGTKFPKSAILRSTHPVIFLSGGLIWAPFNISYLWPGIPIACFTWLYIKPRFLAFWSKYNYVLSAALSAGIAISALIQFALADRGIFINWWGNTVVAMGCEAETCILKTLADGEFFGPQPGTYK